MKTRVAGIYDKRQWISKDRFKAKKKTRWLDNIIS